VDAGFETEDSRQGNGVSLDEITPAYMAHSELEYTHRLGRSKPLTTYVPKSVQEILEILVTSQWRLLRHKRHTMYMQMRTAEVSPPPPLQTFRSGPPASFWHSAIRRRTTPNDDGSITYGDGRV